MKTKVAIILCLLVFASVISQLAASTVFAKASEADAVSMRSFSGCETENGDTVGPQGLPISTPGGPT